MRASYASLWRCAFACAALLCGLNQLRANVRPDVKVALVVGNSEYAADSMKLKNPANDARDIASALQADGFEVDLRVDINEQQFRSVLGDFERKSTHADITLFYFAGHGMQFRGKNFLLPTDNHPHDVIDVKRHSVALDDVVDSVSEARKAKIIILDACRDGGSRAAKSASRSLGGLGDEDGLAGVAGAEGLYVFFSAQHGKQAADGAGAVHSPFALSMLHHIVEPGRKLVDVFEEVTRDVRKVTDGLQEPELVSTSFGDTEIILKEAESSADTWKKVNREDPRALKKFIDDHPDAPEAETAQVILDQLDAKRREEERVDDERKRRRAAEAALEQYQKQEATRRQEDERRAQQAEAEKLANDRKLTEIQANLKAEHDAREAALAQAKQEAAEKLAQQRREDQARLEEAQRKADTAREDIRQAAEASARKTAEADARAEAAKQAAQAADEAKRQAKEADEAAKRKAQEADAKAKAELLRQAQAKAEEARAKEEAAARAREAQRRAEMEAEWRARVADVAEEQRQAEQEARVAAAKQATERHRLEAEAEQKRILDQTCADDLSKLATFRQSGEADAVELLRHNAKCPAVEAAAVQALKEIAAAAAKTCDLEGKALARLDARDATVLSSAAPQYHCAAVRDAALKLADRARQEKVANDAVCAQDEVAIAKIDLSLPEARKTLSALGGSACVATRDRAGKLMADFDQRVSDAQDDLARLGCLEPLRKSGQFDAFTAKALGAYFSARNAPAETIRITQGIVDELSDQEFMVCAPPKPNVVVKPPSGPHGTQVTLLPPIARPPKAQPSEHNHQHSRPTPNPTRTFADDNDAPPVRPVRPQSHGPAGRSLRGSTSQTTSPPPASSGGGGQINIPSF